MAIDAISASGQARGTYSAPVATTPGESAATGSSTSRPDQDSVAWSAAGTAKAAETEGEPSALASLACGALHLPSPGEQAQETDSNYKAGSYLGAAVTVGALLSMLI